MQNKSSIIFRQFSCWLKVADKSHDRCYKFCFCFSSSLQKFNIQNNTPLAICTQSLNLSLSYTVSLSLSLSLTHLPTENETLWVNYSTRGLSHQPTTPLPPKVCLTLSHNYTQSHSHSPRQKPSLCFTSAHTYSQTATYLEKRITSVIQPLRKVCQTERERLADRQRQRQCLSISERERGCNQSSRKSFSVIASNLMRN